MRQHTDDQAAYAKLKQSLAQKHPNDIMAYCLGKVDFIANIDNKTGCNGLRIVKALTPQEWETARHFRQFYFFDKASIADPFTWTFDHKDHVHFILYQGTEIKGYAHIQRWSDNRAALRIIVIDVASRNKGLGCRLLTLCERWLRQQGAVWLQIESSPKASLFYFKRGYVEMPFNDPDHYESGPQDIAIGKRL